MMINYQRRRAQRDGAREGAVRGPRGRGRGRHQRRRSPSRRSKLIKVDYEVLPHVIDVVEAMQPGAPLLHEDMYHRRRRARAQDALQHRQARRVRARRRRGRLQAGRPRRRARVHHQAGAPGLHRAARLHRQRVGGRPGRRVGVDAGPLDRARPLRAAARLGRRQGARHRRRDRRRLRRQDRGLSRADGAGAVQEGAAGP